MQTRGMTALKNGIKTFQPKSRADWRKWLAKNHASERSVWLIIHKKVSGIKGVSYVEAVEEALCFGWIDSTANKRDENSHYQYFAKRKPKSNWSKINKARIEKLMKDGMIMKPGLEIIETAKENGSWNTLDEIDEMITPKDLQSALKKNKKAFENWNRFSDSSKKMILYWIKSAKKDETRIKRIAETIQQAKKNMKANHPK